MKKGEPKKCYALCRDYCIAWKRYNPEICPIKGIKGKQKIKELEERIVALESEHQYPLTIQSMKDLHPVGKNS